MANKTLAQEGLDQLAHAAVAGGITFFLVYFGAHAFAAGFFSLIFMYMREYYQNDRTFLLGPGSVIDLTGSLVGVVIVVIGKVIIA